LSPFNVQYYSDRSPYYASAYLPDAQSSYGAGLSTYQQGNSYFEPSFLPYTQGQYYYPVEVKNLNYDGSLPQLQLYQTPSTSNNENTKTNTNPDSYVRSSMDKFEQIPPTEMNLEKIKADIEEEQQRIRKLQGGLKSYADQLNISSH